MKLLNLDEGNYGTRFWENIGKYAPRDWEVKGYYYPKKIPTFIDELYDYLPQNLSSCDLFLSVQEHPVVAEKIPLLKTFDEKRRIINKKWQSHITT